MGRTKKGGLVGRYGARYGVSVRRRIKETEEVVHAYNFCPSCNAKKVKRVCKGVWECRKCGFKFAGGAYTPIVVREEKSS